MAQIGHELRMTERPRRVMPLFVDVSGIGARGRVPAVERGRHRGVADDTGGAAIAHALEFAVPVLLRQPDLEPHCRLRGRRIRGRTRGPSALVRRQSAA